MLQAYQGYFQEDVKFVADNVILKIPPNKRIIINILDETVDMETEQNEQEIFERIKMLESITGIIPPDIDEKVIRAERITKKGPL